MAELLTAAQMRAIEKAAIGRGEVSGRELMERAGRGVVEAIFEEWPQLAQTDHRAVVLCGPGNNGGDGFVVARLLAGWGWQVDVFLYGEAEKLPPDAKENYRRWCAMGKVTPACGQTPARLAHLPCDLMVDALFGTGLARPIEDICLLDWLGLIDGSPEAPGKRPRPRTVAVDIPSGLGADTGRVMGGRSDHGPRAPRVMLTVTFHARKLGHVLEQGPDYCGHVVLKPIGLEMPVREISPPEAPGVVTLFGREAIAARGLSKPRRGHKYALGHALILSGPSGHGGAARLAARGALRIGAGVVSLGCPHAALVENAAHLDAIMLAEVDDPQALARVLEDWRINALCLGPGLGRERTQALVPVALGSGRAMVLDADGLTGLSDDPAALFGMLHDACVLTPHAGEFARLFPDIAEQLNAPAGAGRSCSKVDATREAARRAGCVVLFKGSDTVIAAPDGRCAINEARDNRAAPWLATAGSGDVLAGFIAGLLARGFDPMQAAETAAWLHVDCARVFGPGLIAEDLPEMLPKVFRDLGI